MPLKRKRQHKTETRNLSNESAKGFFCLSIFHSKTTFTQGEKSSEENGEKNSTEQFSAFENFMIYERTNGFSPPPRPFAFSLYSINLGEEKNIFPLSQRIESLDDE